MNQALLKIITDYYKNKHITEKHANLIAQDYVIALFLLDRCSKNKISHILTAIVMNCFKKSVLSDSKTDVISILKQITPKYQTAKATLPIFTFFDRYINSSIIKSIKHKHAVMALSTAILNKTVSKGAKYN